MSLLKKSKASSGVNVNLILLFYDEIWFLSCRRVIKNVKCSIVRLIIWQRCVFKNQRIFYQRHIIFLLIELEILLEEYSDQTPNIYGKEPMWIWWKQFGDCYLWLKPKETITSSKNCVNWWIASKDSVFVFVRKLIKVMDSDRQHFKFKRWYPFSHAIVY